MKERLFKKNECGIQDKHVSWTSCSMFQSKNNQWYLFHVTFPFKHVVGGREAHKIVGVEFQFSLPTSFPTPFLPQFCAWEDPIFGGMIQCLDQKSHGGMSANQKHQRMISNGWNLGHKTVSNRIPQSASWEKIRALQWFMLNKRNAVMSFVNFDFWCEVHGAATT